MHTQNNSEKNQEKTISVKIESSARVVEENLISDVCVFSLFSFFFFLANFNFLGDDFAFTLGVLQLSVSGLFYLGARERIKYDPFWGNMNIIFAFFFGVFGGVTNILIGLSFSLNELILAIPNVVIGLLMLLSTRGVKDNPLTFFLIWIFAWIGVLSLGLGGCGLEPAFFNKLGGIGLLGVAILGFYAQVAFMHIHAGINMSLGKQLFKN